MWAEDNHNLEGSIRGPHVMKTRPTTVSIVLVLPALVPVDPNVLFETSVLRPGDGYGAMSNSFDTE